MINILIVDDEEEAREGLKVMIDQYPQGNLLGAAQNGLEAIQMIVELKPDVVLLDIQMPEINGFDVLNNINSSHPPFVIFVTAFDSYALKAFEHHAIDYVLKPFTNDRLFRALDHAKEMVNQKMINSKLENLLLDYQKNRLEDEGDALITKISSSDQKLVVKSSGKVHFIPYREILWVEAYDYYIKIHVSDKYYLVRQSLKNMEHKLPGKLFYRVHKSSIVNAKFIKDVISKSNGDYELVLSSGTAINMSRNYNSCLKQICQLS